MVYIELHFSDSSIIIRLKQGPVRSVIVYRCPFSIFPSFKTVFVHISKHLEVQSSKILRYALYLSLVSVFGNVVKKLVWDCYLTWNNETDLYLFSVGKKYAVTKKKMTNKDPYQNVTFWSSRQVHRTRRIWQDCRIIQQLACTMLKEEYQQIIFRRTVKRVQWPGLWMVARLQVTLFWLRLLFFCWVNQVILFLNGCKTASERFLSFERIAVVYVFAWEVTFFENDKRGGLYQGKIISSRACLYRPGTKHQTVKGPIENREPTKLSVC